jgi:hypothetical protein
MAILDTLPYIKSRIYVDGQPLEKFDDNEDEEHDVGPAAEYRSARTMTKYIESISDKEYAVKLDIDALHQHDSPSLLHRINIDGKQLATNVLSVSKTSKGYGRPRAKISTIDGQKVQDSVGRGTLRKFKFSKIGT